MIEQPLATRTIKDLKPDDVVKSCKYMEKGSSFALEGMLPCVHGSISAPVLITADEIKNKTATYELAVQRREELFAAVNGMRSGPSNSCNSCLHLEEKKYKDVNFGYLGGEEMPGGINIQHYTSCNQRCTYCVFTIENKFEPPAYNIIDFLEMFREKGKLRGNNWIDFSGGEPSLLKNFDELLDYFQTHLGRVVVYTNASVFSQSIYNALKENKIYLTTSLDTGLPSSYKKLHGTNTFAKVVANLIRYRNSGTNRIRLKYIVCDTNRTEDDLWSFLAVVLAVRADRVMISPSFPYGDAQIPKETVKFAAQLWYLVEKFTGNAPIDYTTAMQDAKYETYRAELAAAIQELKRVRPLSGEECIVDELESAPVARATRNLLTAIREHLWRTRLRKTLLPDHSRRLAAAQLMWRKLFDLLLHRSAPETSARPAETQSACNE